MTFLQFGESPQTLCIKGRSPAEGTRPTKMHFAKTLSIPLYCVCKGFASVGHPEQNLLWWSCPRMNDFCGDFHLRGEVNQLRPPNQNWCHKAGLSPHTNGFPIWYGEELSPEAACRCGEVREGVVRCGQVIITCWSSPTPSRRFDCTFGLCVQHLATKTPTLH